MNLFRISKFGFRVLNKLGQKINPTGFRIGSFLSWQSRWFTDKRKFKDHLFEDITIRKALMEKLKLAGIIKVEIERLPKSMVVIMTVARPGVVIGRGGSGIEEVKKLILDVIKKTRKGDVSNVRIDPRVIEIKNPELSAHLVATRIASELERRLPHRRVVSKAIDRVMQSGARGIKIVLSGRIGGTEIGRIEKFHQGSVPTQTLRKNIDYAQVPALLKRGYVGVKVFIHKDSKEE